MRSAAFWICLAVAPLYGSAPIGIPRQLAQQRAGQISDIRYHLAFRLVPHAGTTVGHEEATFQLESAVPLLIDFRGGTVSSLHVNGVAVDAGNENGHIALPVGSLHAGENRLSVDFAAPMAPAGRAIIRYEDKDDGSEYIYTLFVPMDASMAFPCFDQPDLKARFTLALTAPADWTVLSNSAAAHAEKIDENTRTEFGETRPISTYLFAFAAGPFRNVHATPGMPNVWV